MKLVTAFVRTTALEHIVKALEAKNIRSMTIGEVKGTGKEVSLNKPYTIHDRIDIVVPDDKAEDVVDIILQHGQTGLVGDGLVFVLPAETVVKIRTRERLA